MRNNLNTRYTLVLEIMNVIFQVKTNLAITPNPKGSARFIFFPPLPDLQAGFRDGVKEENCISFDDI
jgi:hypothetical protein